MEFGLFYEITVPKPWDGGREAQVFREVIEQVRYAEEIGFRYVWLTEHHFQEEYSHCSSPEVVLGALSQVTTEMRLGHGVVLTPPAYNNPIRVAERVATLDCLSNGRVELGTGRSVTQQEMYGFGIDPARSREMWEEGLESIVKLLSEEQVTLDGEFFSMPPRTVVPRCVQKPHPPLWMAGTSPSTIERAAAAGLGVLFFSHGVAPEDLSVSVERYRREITSAKPIGKAVNNRLAGFCIGLCGEDDAETREVGGAAAFQYLTGGVANCIWDDPPPPTLEYTAQFRTGLERMRRAGPDVMIDRGMLMAGNPDSCNNLVREYADLGVDQLIIHMQNWDLPHERIMESIRTFGTHIIPEYSRG